MLTKSFSEIATNFKVKALRMLNVLAPHGNKLGYYTKTKLWDWLFQMIRIIDMVLALVGLAALSPICGLVMFFCVFDTGSPLFCQERLGRNKKPFILVKFRTMSKDTASVASHLASSSSITKLGRFLRRTKLDELPQLWNVLKGEMSLVGPRPGLPNQEALTGARSRLNVYSVRPGITGLAQVNGFDMSKPELLAATDAKMIAEMSVSHYFKYILLTIIGKGQGDRINRD